MAVKNPIKKAAKPAAHTHTKGAHGKNGTSNVIGNGRASSKRQWVFLFNDEKGVNKVTKNWGEVRELLGGKGAGLFDMTRAGLPVPPGFTLSTEVCDAFVAAGNKIPKEAWEQTLAAMKVVEKQTGKVFGGGKAGTRPLLVSVRSGARESMPGMMETVLNVGLNDKTVAEMIALTGNERFVYDSYRRLLMMFGATVLGIDDEKFDEPMEHLKHARGVKLDTELTAADLKELADAFKGVIKAETGKDFPQDVYAQLHECAMAVFRSATGHKAKTYAKQMGWKNTLPTAVNVCTMVFGNMGDDCATGVAFTRDPSTGEKGCSASTCQRPGRGRGGRHPHAQADRRDGDRDARYLQAVHEDQRFAGEALQEHAGHGVHRRAGQALHAADAQRQAHRQERDQDRGGSGQRKVDQQGRSHQARDTGRCGLPAAPTVRRERDQRRQDRRPLFGQGRERFTRRGQRCAGL